MPVTQPAHTTSRNENPFTFNPDQSTPRAGNTGLKPDRRPTAPSVVIRELDDKRPQRGQFRVIPLVPRSQLAGNIRVHRHVSEIDVEAMALIEQVRHERAFPS